MRLLKRLANELSITPMFSDPRVYADALGKPRFISSMGPDDGSHAYIRQDIFERLLKDKDLVCVWTFVAERGVWPGGGNSHAAWRRSEGVVWFERGKPKMESWKEDMNRPGFVGTPNPQNRAFLSARFWPRVCKNASPKLKCAHLR